MGTYSAFKTNPELETKGIVIDYGDAGRFRIARAGGANASYQKKLAALAKPIRRQIQAETIGKEKAEEIMAEAFFHTVLLGWEGVTDADGNELPYSIQNARTLFADLPDLLADLVESAQKASLFRDEVAEQDAKN